MSDLLLTHRTREEAHKYLSAQVEGMRYKPIWLVKNCAHVLSTQHFFNWVGSSSGTDHSHHAYPGGLIIHTAEVMEGALQLCPGDLTQPIPSSNIIVPAVLFHDFAKLHDYSATGEKMPYRDLIRHVAGSFAAWWKLTEQIHAEDWDLFLQIGHCILAHHGKFEWGSPVMPQTAEAKAIHEADMFSMQFGPGREGPKEIENATNE